MESTANHYEVLGVSSDSPLEAIRRAYMQRCLDWHPDRASPAASSVLFTRANTAYEVLRDSGRRARYDATLRRVVTDVVLLCDMTKAEPDSDHNDQRSARYSLCRCGGEFHVDDETLVAREGGAAVIECDTCSLAIRVVDDEGTHIDSAPVPASAASEAN